MQCLLLHCYYIIITHYYIKSFHVVLHIITISLLHCYYIIITYYYIIHYYLLLHFLLLHCYYIFIITYYHNIIIAHHYIITSLLGHYYFIIPNFAKTGNNERIITYYALSLFSLLQCYYPLLPLLPIITCYQQGNLQMLKLPLNHTSGQIKNTEVMNSEGRSTG